MHFDSDISAYTKSYEILYTGCVVCRRDDDGSNRGCEFCPNWETWISFPRTPEGARAFVMHLSGELPPAA